MTRISRTSFDAQMLSSRFDAQTPSSSDHFLALQNEHLLALKKEKSPSPTSSPKLVNQNKKALCGPTADFLNASPANVIGGIGTTLSWGGKAVAGVGGLFTLLDVAAEIGSPSFSSGTLNDKLNGLSQEVGFWVLFTGRAALASWAGENLESGGTFIRQQCQPASKKP